MKKRAAGTGRKQEKTPVTMSVAVQQLMLPLLLAMDATKKELLSFVQQMGMVALSELLVTEAAMIAGPKGKHIEGRTHHSLGTGTTPVCFGGRNVSLPHPRVRARGKGPGREVTLLSVEALREGDPMSERVVEQIALGVSTRGYERSLEPVEGLTETRGARGRPRHRRSAERLPTRQGLRPHGLPRCRPSPRRRDRGVRGEGRVRSPTSKAVTVPRFRREAG